MTHVFLISSIISNINALGLPFIFYLSTHLPHGFSLHIVNYGPVLPFV